MGQPGRRGRDEKLELLARQGWARSATADDRRWLGRVSDEVRADPGGVIARRARPARWIYLVVEGDVLVGDVTAGPGRCVSPADGDVVATTGTVLLAVAAADEAELRRRFAGVETAPVASRRCLPHCPISALLTAGRRRDPVSAPV